MYSVRGGRVLSLSSAAGARALSYRKKLDAKAITSSYGYCSKVYKSAVKVFCRALTKPKSERTRVFLRGMKKASFLRYPLPGKRRASAGNVSEVVIRARPKVRG
jgi:hypothetical protein